MPYQGYSGSYQSGGYSGAYSSASFQSRKNIPLPEQFKCRICQRHKSVNLFSKKEHGTYQNAVMNGRPVGPDAHFLQCRLCSGAPEVEIECSGPCHMWKSIDDFSKSQRQETEPWCIVCVCWKLANDPADKRAALPVPHAVATHDEQGEVGEEKVNATGYVSEEEDSSKEDEYQSSRVKSSAASGILIDIGSDTMSTSASVGVQSSGGNNTLHGGWQMQGSSQRAPSVSQASNSGAHGVGGSRNQGSRKESAFPKIPRERPAEREPYKPLPPSRNNAPVIDPRDRDLL